MRIEFESCSQNEAFARTVVAAYITRAVYDRNTGK